MAKIRFHAAASASLTLLGWVVPESWGQVPAVVAPRAEEVAANSRSELSGRAGVNSLVTTAGPKAVPRLSGVAAPGLKITLDGSASSGGRVWYRWVQTIGSRVAIQQADQAEAHLNVPDDVTTLGFVLVVGNNFGIDARSLVVAVEDPERDGADAMLKADLEANPTATVGQRVVLDAGKSEPRGRLRYRWVQLTGPRVEIQVTAGPTCSFVPEVVADYQFALLVIGATGLVSEPAVATIQVAEPKAGDADGPGGRLALETDDLAKSALESIPGGIKYANDLAKVFDTVADRIESFKTYREAATETTRRLDAVVPRDPERRTEWVERFFQPWTARVADRMRASGTNLEQPDDQTKPLTRPQRARLADQFRVTAAGLRAVTTLR